MGHKKICTVLHGIEIAKKKIMEKCLDATRLDEIRYQTSDTYREKKLNRKDTPIGHKKICAVLHEIEIAVINK
jgi:hypothetical protein